MNRVQNIWEGLFRFSLIAVGIGLGVGLVHRHDRELPPHFAWYLILSGAVLNLLTRYIIQKKKDEEGAAK
jgi:hypothetical protein